jgi:hypothetical protein
MTSSPASRAARSAALPAVLLALLLVALAATPALAHAPDPLLGSGLWKKDAVATFQWGPGATPPGWAATAISAGALDVAESRDSRAATFVRVSSGAPATMSYGGSNLCDSYGIACMDRTGMSVDGTFRVWFRPQGWTFDWGTLKWCQFYSSAPNGCYDIETTSLDELGHVEILGHHVNLPDESDFTDAVVQYAGHVRPKAGWNQHLFGRCDVARLQLEYERRSPSNLVSTCLSLPTTLTVSASTDTVTYGSSVTFTASLKIASSAAEALSGDWLSDHSVQLQRRVVGGTTWSTVVTMSPSSAAEGTYYTTISPTQIYDWRAYFPTPANEGVTSSASGTTRVYVSTCFSPPCPLAATR